MDKRTPAPEAREIRKSVAEQIFGANKAPLDEVLNQDFADVAKGVAALAQEIKDLPAKVKSEADFARWGSFSTKVTAYATRLEELRTKETKPMFDANKAIKLHFDTLADSLKQAIAPLTKAANDYVREKDARERVEREAAAKALREKEEQARQKAEDGGRGAARAAGQAETFGAQAEELERTTTVAENVRVSIAGGGSASASNKYSFTITDYDKIDLEKLRPFLKREAIEQAIRAVVNIHKEKTEITGVTVTRDVEARARK